MTVESMIHLFKVVMDRGQKLSLPILYPFSSGIKVIHNYHLVSNMATGIKGVCNCCSVCEPGQCDYFTFLILRQVSPI